MLWSSSLFLATYHPAYEVAGYNVSHRISNLLGYLLIVFFTVYGPRYSTLLVQGKIGEVKRLILRNCLVVFIVSLPISILVMYFGKDILAVFGDEYVSGYLSLVILVVGQLLANSVGSAEHALLMSENKRMLLIGLLLTALLSLPLGFLLIKNYGLIGASISTSMLLVFQKMYCFLIMVGKGKWIGAT